MAVSKVSTVTTSYLLSNLHCPSCVAYIKTLLFDAYGNSVSWVSPNLVTSVVTVEHADDQSVSVKKIEKTLEEAGFEICGVHTDARMADDADRYSRASRAVSSRANTEPGGAWSWLWRPKNPESARELAMQMHVQNCVACRHSAAYAKQTETDYGKSVNSLDKVGAKETFTGTVIGAGAGPRYRATVSIGGMTCAACSNAITQEVQKIDWVDKIVVNLVTNSASIDFNDGSPAEEIVEAIEDIGYDAILDKVIDLHEKRSAEEKDIEIGIEGIFCRRCPERIVQTLTSFPAGNIDILHEPSFEHPVLRIRYIPQAPEFTIRHILQAIDATDPELSSHIFHPPTLEERSRAVRAQHQKQLLWREILTVIVAIPTFILGIVFMSLVSESDQTRQYLMKPWTNGINRNDIALCILATPVYFFAADIFHVRALKEVRTLWRQGSRTPFLARFYKFGSMNMLMSLGTTIAYFSSLGQLIAAAARHDYSISSKEFYFDSVVFLTLFLLAGRLIEAFSKSKTGDAVEALAKLRPSTALLVETNKKSEERTARAIAVDQIEVNDVIRVPHGASPPADGIVIHGETSFDESSLTGESRLIHKETGDQVFAGTVNKSDAVLVRVTGASGKSMLDQIVEVVREGQTKRAPMEQIADILTTYFVPAITLVALVTFVIWMSLALTGRIADQADGSTGQHVAFAFRFAIAVFVVACPCGLALAAPTAIFVGGGLAAKHGILAKGGGEAFEKASQINTVVFDKTGTLTVGGAPQVTDSSHFPDGESDQVDRLTTLSALKALEENSSHPIAKALAEFCGTSEVPTQLENVKEVPGKGMQASCVSHSFDILVGNEHLVRDHSIRISGSVTSLLQAWKSEAKSIAIAAVKPHDHTEWTICTALAVSDAIRAETVPVIKELKNSGVEVWMLSGDNATTAKAVANLVGIDPDNVLAEVLPSEKAAKITYLQATLHTSGTKRHLKGPGRAMIAMVGDGINDSPALTTADVGIAIGSGSDVAISSADFILATSNLNSVLTLIELSRVVFRRIKLNFGWALVYNLLAVPIAAGCFYAVRTDNGGRVELDPVWASLAMALSSISVVLSSLALRVKIPGVGFRPRASADEGRHMVKSP